MKTVQPTLDERPRTLRIWWAVFTLVLIYTALLWAVEIHPLAALPGLRLWGFRGDDSMFGGDPTLLWAIMPAWPGRRGPLWRQAVWLYMTSDHVVPMVLAFANGFTVVAFWKVCRRRTPLRWAKMGAAIQISLLVISLPLMAYVDYLKPSDSMLADEYDYLYFLIASAPLLPLVVSLAWWRIQGEKTPWTPALNTCVACGYDLRGSPPSGPCPECGASQK